MTFAGREFLRAGLNVTDNPLLVPPSEMVEATNILVGATLARKKRGGQAYFNTDGEDENATYPLNPKNNSGTDGGPILGAYEFLRYDSGTGAPKSTLLVRQADKIWAIEERTGVAVDITGSLTLPTTGEICFQTFEGKVYWTSSNTTEGYNKWTGTGNATAVTNVAATFSGAITGVTGSVELSADTAGTGGNSILLTGDGAKSLSTLVSDWNTANPDNEVTLDSANGADIPDAAEAMQLAGGLWKLPPDGTPSVIIAHGGRMWGLGVPGFPYRAYYTEFYDAETFATKPFGTTGTAAEAGSLDMDPYGDPQGLVGGISFQKRLYLFLRRSIFEISGYTINDFVVQPFSKKYGAVAHATIVDIGNDVIFTSESGPTRLSSTDTAKEAEARSVTRPIKKLWDKNLNRTKQAQYCAVYDEEESLYLLSCASAGSTTNDIILAYNVDADVWSGSWDGIKARTLANYIIDGRNRVVAGREDGVISVLGDPSRLDLGNQFTARMKTGFLYPGEEIDLQYIWNTATLLASTTGIASLTFNAYVDSRLIATETIDIRSGEDLLGTSFILGQSILGSGQFTPQTIPLTDQGYGLQLEILFNTEADVEVYGFMVDATPADHLIGG